VGQTGFFDPYVGVGLGYTQANDQGRGTYNAVIGFRTWFSDRFGLDFSSSGKWSMNTDATNHLQHAVGVVYQFGIEKELSFKGKDKLALLEALEAEQNRRNDSIAQAQSDQQAKLLAAQIAQEQEQKQLAEAAQEKLRNERDTLENDINALGNVYFELNSSYLTSAAKLILTKLVQLLEDKPQVKLQVSSFTDSRGAENYNTWLSERRAQRTIDYLVQKGIEGDRLIPNAAGENGLLNECDDHTYCTESKHKINRRSEFKVIYE
jgi:outer membrane protein OmpA-like peptidoglycan-associated protein